jgi:hypothetical protein
VTKTKIALIVLSVIVVFYVGGAFYYYRFPEPFLVPTDSNIEGLAYTNTLRIITEEMVDHWPVNDIFFWPSNLLDNPQNFRLGQLEALRRATRVLRDNLSRLRAEDPINPNVDTAFTSFAIDPGALIMPRAEFKYDEGLEGLTQYAADLTNNEARFYARVDTLRELMEEFLILLGATGQRLRAVYNGTGEGFNIDDGEATPPRRRAEEESDFLSWRQTDDAFYYARGVAYVLSHLLVAVRHDFDDVIEKRRAENLFTAVIPDLEACQFEPWIVTAGKQGSVFANHPLQMQAHIVSARQKLRAVSNVIGSSTIAN